MDIVPSSFLTNSFRPFSAFVCKQNWPLTFVTTRQRKNFPLRDFSFFAFIDLQPASWDVPLFRIQPLTQPTITKRTSSKLKTHLRTPCSFALPSHAPFLIQNSPPPQNTLFALTTNPTKHEPPKLFPTTARWEGTLLGALGRF